METLQEALAATGESLWWLSFCAETPDGEFLGCAIVPGTNITTAINAAWALKCNPGGECMGARICPALAKVIPGDKVGVRLSREEAHALDELMLAAMAQASGPAVGV